MKKLAPEEAIALRAGDKNKRKGAKWSAVGGFT